VAKALHAIRAAPAAPAFAWAQSVTSAAVLLRCWGAAPCGKSATPRAAAFARSGAHEAALR